MPLRFENLIEETLRPGTQRLFEEQGRLYLFTVVGPGDYILPTKIGTIIGPKYDGRIFELATLGDKYKMLDNSDFRTNIVPRRLIPVDKEIIPSDPPYADSQGVAVRTPPKRPYLVGGAKAPLQD